MTINKRKCPSCGADLEPLAVTCLYCESPTAPVALSPRLRVEIAAHAVAWNDCLTAPMKRISALALTGMLAGMAVTILLVYLLYFFYQIKPGWLFLTGSILLLADYFLANNLKITLLHRSLGRIYDQQISPQIMAFSLEQSIPHWQLESVLKESLPDKSPLSSFLRAIKSPDRKSL